MTRRRSDTFLDDAGKTTSLESVGVPYFDESHRVAGVAGIARDVSDRRPLDGVRADAQTQLEQLVQDRTAQLRAAIERLTAEVEERRRAEAVALRHERALRTLSEVNETLVRATDEAALMTACCRIIVERGGYRLAWVGHAEQDPERRVRPVARAGPDEDYVDGVDATWRDDQRGRGPMGTAIRTGHPALARNVASDTWFEPWRSAAMSRGFGSMIALPLRAEDVTIGALGIYCSDVDAFDDDERKLLADLADDIAFGVMAMRGRAQRTEMRAQLTQADRLVAMGTMAAGVAHEINNPLAYLLAGVEFVSGELRRADASLPSERIAEIRQALVEVREGAQRIRQVVRDLKVFSRGDDEAHGPVDVQRVLESSLQMAGNEIRHRARLIKRLDPAPAVDANESRLGQVFLNLLINAVHAIPAGAADHNAITVSTGTDQEGRAVVEVSDTGKGMAPEITERIFEPFFTTKPVGVGTGLGLAICRNIVSSLGGQITVESTCGHGTTFRVVLPACRHGGRAEPPGPLPHHRGARILAIDDEPLVLNAIRRMLGREHAVCTETSARSALDRLTRGERFDLVLCDLMMPQMTGVEFHEALAATLPAEAARIVFLTGGAFTPATKTFLDVVPNRRIDKPFDTERLRRLVLEATGDPDAATAGW